MAMTIDRSVFWRWIFFDDVARAGQKCRTSRDVILTVNYLLVGNKAVSDRKFTVTTWSLSQKGKSHDLTHVK